MTTLIPFSISTISLIPETAFSLKKTNNFTRCNFPRKSSKHVKSSQRHLVPPLRSIGLFPQYKRDCGWLHNSVLHTVSATGTGTDVVIEESDSPVVDENSTKASDTPADAVETSEKSTIKSDTNKAPPQAKRSRPGRKSEMPPVKNEDLIPGAKFTGKVRSIQPFGAFVDFGAFTDGLVHVSRLSDNFVKDVGNVVSVGQEVTVRLVEANTETGRISLTMRESDDSNKLQQQKDAPAASSSGKPRPARRNPPKPGQKREDVKTSKFVKGQELEGAVKNLTRSGTFISLPEGEEGFLPTLEESDGGLEAMMGGSSLEVGQAVSVRVLRVARGQVTLTMKGEEDNESKVDIVQGVVHAATNPFVLAFRKNKEIASFLDEREQVIDQPAKPKTPTEVGQEKQTESVSSIPKVQGQPSSTIEESVSVASTVSETIEDLISSKELPEELSIPGDDKDSESTESVSLQSTEFATQTVEKEAEIRGQPSNTVEESVSVIFSVGETVEDKTSSKEVPEKPSIAGDDKDPESAESVSFQSAEGAIQTVKETEVPGQPTSTDEESVSVASSVGETVEDKSSSKEVPEKTSIAGDDKDLESPESVSFQSAEGAIQTVEKEEESSAISDPKDSVSTADNLIEEASLTDMIESDEIPGSSGEISSEISSPVSLAAGSQLGDSKENDEVQATSAENEISSTAPVLDEGPGAATPDEKGSITGSDESVENSAPSVSTGVAEVMSSEIQGIGEGVENIVEKTKDASTGVAEVLSSEIQGIGEGVENIVEKTKDASTGVAEVLSSEIQGIGGVENVIEKTKDVSTGVAEVLSSEIQGIGEGVENIVEKTKDVSTGVAEVLSSEIQGIGKGVENMVEKTKDVSTGVAQVLASEIQGIGEGVENMVKKTEDVSTGVAEVLASEIQGIGEGVENIVENTKDVSTGVAEVLPSDFQGIGGVENIVEKTKDVSTGVAEVLSSDFQGIGGVQNIVEKTKDVSTGVAEVLSSEIQGIGEAVDNIVEKTRDTGVVEVPSSGIQGTREAIENLVEKTKDEVQNQTSAAEAEVPSAIQAENGKVELAPEKSDSSNSNGQSDGSSTEKSVKATISPALVKQLREETGAGMMDCKKALSETGGDIVKAQEFLRKKGLASAEKKASRATAEGRIGSYIHDSRIGVLVEVNCETDFVSRGEIFKELVDDLAMQVAACPQVQYLVPEDVPEEIVNKEKEIEMQKEDLLSKPEQIRSKIVEGRIGKRLAELALLEQPYIKNDKVVIKDWVKQTIATIGENIKVRRFVRFNLGEGLEKKSQDFAAEVAAQTAAKAVAAPTKEQSASAETKELVEKPPAVAISAALVKQLREETGAGMMDCKKALSETGGDLEKAQEYLRKKGLSAADKKSSRLAAEGRIGSYIHDSRIGVLIEINCETDFVGRSEKFKELVDDLAMQVVACPQVQFVSIEEIRESFVKREKELEMQREDLASKPENTREKIVEGRISKRLGELALLEQPFIKDDSILVKDLIKQSVAAIGENIKVRRFVRFTLGENTEEAKTETEA